jgi:hypothetical protein
MVERRASSPVEACHVVLMPVMLSGNAAQAALESKHPGAVCSGTNVAAFSATGHAGFILENVDAFAVTHAAAGSFDCARLSPRSAQDGIEKE